MIKRDLLNIKVLKIIVCIIVYNNLLCNHNFCFVKVKAFIKAKIQALFNLCKY